MSQCLKKSEILTDKEEISNLFHTGEWRRGKLVHIVILPATERKVLFATARSFKNAVKRHKGRRYLREIYRKHGELFPSSFIYGIILKRIPHHDPYNRIRNDIQSVMAETHD